MSNDTDGSKTWVSNSFPRWSSYAAAMKRLEEKASKAEPTVSPMQMLLHSKNVEPIKEEDDVATEAPKPKPKPVFKKKVVIKNTFNTKKIHRFLIREDDVVFYVPVGILKVSIKDNVRRELDRFKLGSLKEYMTERMQIGVVCQEYTVDPDRLPSCKHNVKSSYRPQIGNHLYQWSQPKDWTGTTPPSYDLCISPEVLKDSKQVPIGCDFQERGINYCPNYEPEVPETYNLEDETGNQYQLEIQPVYTSRTLSYSLRDSTDNQVFVETLGYVTETPVDIVLRKTTKQMTVLNQVEKEKLEDISPFLSNILATKD